MMVAYECPECDSHDTKQVHVEWARDLIEETRVCNECPAQFTNAYNLFDQRVEEVPA